MAVDRLGQQDIVSDAKAIFSLLSPDLRANTGTGSEHEPVTLSACVENMFDISTAQVLTVDDTTNPGDLFTINAASALGRLAIGSQFDFLQPDTDAASLVYTACPNVGDGASAYFGGNQDVAMGYDEAGDDQFVVTGASWFFNGPQVNIGAAVGGGGEPLAVRTDQNANTGIELVNANAGAAATALARFKNTAGAGGNHALDVGVLGTGFTTAGIAYQDSGMIQTGTGLAGGLTIRTLAAAPVVCGVSATDEVWRADANGLTIPNDVAFNFGTGQDAIGQFVSANNRVEWTGVDWLFDDQIVNIGTVGGGGELLAIRNDVDGSFAGIEVVNNDGGTDAFAAIVIKNTAGAGYDHSLNLTTVGTGYTGWTGADKGVITTGDQLSGGLLFATETTAPIVWIVDGAGGLEIEGMRLNTTELVVNDGNANLDSRFESVNQTHELFIDAANDVIGIRANNPAASAEGLYIPWITGDALPTLYVGDTASDQVSIYAISETGVGLRVNLSGAGAIADFQDGGASVWTFQDGGNLLAGTTGTLDLNGNADALILDANADTTISAPTDDQIDFECNGLDAATLTPTTLSITEYFMHLGDADTYWRFQADQADLYCGGVAMISAVEAASDYLNLHAGLVGINETSNANMAIGLTIDQAANDDEALNIRSSDVGAVRSTVETGTYLRIQKQEGAAGGCSLLGLKDGDGTGSGALQLNALLAMNTDTAKTTAARAIVEILGRETNGSNVTDTVADGNVLAVRTQRSSSLVTLMVIDEDADMNLPSGRIATSSGDYWDLEDYHAGAPTADGYVQVTINGTTYQLLANIP